MAHGIGYCVGNPSIWWTLLLMLIKVIPACRFLIPVVSEGGIVLRQTYCIKPKGHLDHHQNAEGGIMVNNLQLRRQMGNA